MAQDHPDVSVASRELSQCLARLRGGVLQATKRVIRYFRRYPHCIIEVVSDQKMSELDVRTDSDRQALWREESLALEEAFHWELL